MQSHRSREAKERGRNNKLEGSINNKYNYVYSGPTNRDITWETERVWGCRGIRVGEVSHPGPGGGGIITKMTNRRNSKHRSSSRRVRAS